MVLQIGKMKETFDFAVKKSYKGVASTEYLN